MTRIKTPTIEQVIKKMRNSVNDPKFRTISAQQKALTGDSPAQGPIWVSRLELPPPPESDVVHSLLQAIEELGVGDESFAIPKLVPVRGEWVGYRRSVDEEATDEKATELRIPEDQKYEALISEMRTTTTLLFVHGGAF